MADYLTHDVTLDFGNETPEDTTLNMLRFHNRKTTLVIARSTVGQHQSLDQALVAQLELLRHRTEDLTISAAQPVQLGRGAQVEGREMTIRLMGGDTLVCQLQVVCLIPGQQRLLVLNYSKQGSLSDEDINHWHAIKQTLRFS